MVITTRDKVVVAGIAAFGTMLAYYVLFGKKHKDERDRLTGDLDKVGGENMRNCIVCERGGKAISLRFFFPVCVRGRGQRVQWYELCWRSI